MPAAPLRSFRLAFAAIWLVYDVSDLATSATGNLGNWLETAAPRELQWLQAGLIATEVGLLLLGGRWVLPLGAAAALLRVLEYRGYLRLNDFAYYVATVAILANTRGPGLLSRGTDKELVPRWPRDVLVWQAAWMYLATGTLKLSPAWLSGGHLWVRFEYLAALGWHYPAVVRQCVDSLACDRVLAVMGVVGEIGLGVLLFVRPRRRLVLPIAIAIHGFGALMTNVWFFGPSLVAQVGLLLTPDLTPRPPASQARGGERETR